MFSPLFAPLRRKIFVFAFLCAALTGAGPLWAAPEAPQTAPQRAPVSLVFRAAEHPDFDRLVFDAPRGFSYKLQREGAEVQIVFAAPAEVKIKEPGLSRVRGLRAAMEPGTKPHLVVRFNVAAKAILKDFLSGASIVIDVYGPPAPEQAAKPQETAKEAPQKPEPAKTPTPVASSAPAAPPPVSLPPAAAQAAPSQAPTNPVAAPQKPLDQIARSLAASAAKLTSVNLIDNKNLEHFPAKDNAPTHSENALIADKAKPSSVAAPAIQIGDDPVQIATFDPRVVVGLVAYARAGVGTVFFDRKITLDPAALSGGNPLHVQLEPIDLPRNSGFRFEMPEGAELHATRAGTAWQIFVTRPKNEIAVATQLVAQPDFALGARLLLPTANASEPVRYVDPVVGDTLILVPLRDTIDFLEPRRLADLQILPSAQGLVVRPEHSQVVARIVSDGVEITSEGGLKLSPAHDRTTVTGDARKKRTKAKTIFNLNAWRGRPGQPFTEARQTLMQTIADVPEAQKPLARLELARFYFARGMAEESLAILGLMEKQNPDLVGHPEYIAFRGADRILEGADEEGLKDLESPLLEGTQSPEIDLWKAVGYANLRDWDNAEQRFLVGQDVLADYPEPFRSHFTILSVEAALAAGKDHEAADWLATFEAGPYDEKVEPAVKYLKGVLASKAGHAEQAGALWREAAHGDDRLYKIRAELALTDLGVATHSLTPLQAVDRLEGLRFAWRGDELEIDILQRLGEYYFDAKNYKAGLGALGQALRYYPTSPLASALRAEMSKVFRDLFLTPKGDGFSPIEALALYEEYQDLKPTGDDGNAIQLSLAEKLVPIDLLDQAGNLMTDLVKNGLKGAEKARVGTRLAGIRLLDHRPDLALAALDLSQAEAAQAPPEMQAERLVLRARAMAETKKYDDALALLQNAKQPAALALRADILMKAQRWPDAAKALLDVAGPPPKAGAVLTKDQADALLSAAIALSLANDNPGLDKLAIDYGAAMTGTAQEDTFRVLTRPEKAMQVRDIAAAQTKLSEVDMFRGFLDAYRKGEGK
jgi:hypothetical protein